jgi:uncharacterized membrane protein
MDSMPRPEPPPLTITDWLLESAALVLLVGLWVLVAVAYPYLPEVIPIHFNLKGQADGFGSKDFIWLEPLVASALYTVMTLVNRRPDTFNYPVKITPENAGRQYALASRLMRYLKLIVVAVMLIIVLFVALPAMGVALALPNWLLPAFLVLIFGPVATYIWRSVQEDKKP